MAARFSDSVNLDYQKEEKEGTRSDTYNYRNSFKIAPGEYTLKLVVNAGSGKFGKYIGTLVVEPFSIQQFTLSGPAFGNTIVPFLLGATDIDQSLTEGTSPLVSNEPCVCSLQQKSL